MLWSIRALFVMSLKSRHYLFCTVLGFISLTTYDLILRIMKSSVKPCGGRHAGAQDSFRQESHRAACCLEAPKPASTHPRLVMPDGYKVPRYQSPLC